MRTVADVNEADSTASLSRERATVLTFEALGEPKRAGRFRLLSNVLAHVSPDNWRGVIDGFERQKRYEGREYQDEWRLALERIGEVATKTAVEETLSENWPNRAERAGLLFIGWVGNNPDGAQAWYEAQPREIQEQLRFALLEGLTRSAPEKALELSETSRIASLDQSPFQIVRGAIQRGGFASGEHLLEILRHRPDATDGFKQQVFAAVAEKKILMSGLQGNPLDSLNWLGNYLGNNSPAGGGAVQQIVDTAARADADVTLRWIEEHASFFTDEQANAAFPTALLALWQKDPARFNDWIAANRDHPQYDQIAEGMVLFLRHQGQLTDARQWNSTIRDEKIRMQLDNIIRAGEAAVAGTAGNKRQ